MNTYRTIDTTPAAMSVGEAARRLGVCKQTVEKAVDRGELPGRRVAGRILVFREPLEALLRGETRPFELNYDEMARELRIRELRAVIASATRELEDLERASELASVPLLIRDRRRKTA